MKNSSLKPGPLDGIRILDLTSVMMGPYCTQVLADMGADVIKIEAPAGDTSRGVPPFRDSGTGSQFRSMHRGKRGIVIDLQKPDGLTAFMDLVGTADVVVHSMRPQAVAKLGIAYADLVAANPSIICCNFLGFGRGGPYAGGAAYDDIIQACSGLVMLQDELLGEPNYIPTVLADKVTGLTGVYAILAALLHRDRTGEGQDVDVPMFETLTSFVLIEHLAGQGFEPPIGRPVYPRVVTPSRKPFRTADGYLAVLVYNDKQWRRFAELAGRPELIDDPRYATLTARSNNVLEWNGTVAEILATRTNQEWMQLLWAADIPAMRLNRTDDLFTDPHLAEVNFFQLVDDPVDGTMRFPKPPVQFSRTPGGFDRAGPLLGEHTVEILREAGIDESRITAMLANGSIAQPERPPRA
ncbi:CaiB/BaiF CoA transferase family protein [Paraburkholderia sp. EG286B]|uniref:CaiB/BaiF CoA transferase family protein n=1 Tax=Paraburkholderia sp. EG286B TaxID=3237011 RepID=UPI0034D26448